MTKLNEQPSYRFQNIKKHVRSRGQHGIVYPQGKNENSIGSVVVSSLFIHKKKQMLYQQILMLVVLNNGKVAGES